MVEKFKIKNDNYKKARGGYSKVFLLSCAFCKQKLCFYQKDGPGVLKRLYFDRIDGEVYTDNNTDLEDVPQLICSKCNIILGVPIIYEKENRKAYRLFVGAICKKTVKNLNNLK